MRCFAMFITAVCINVWIYESGSKEFGPISPIFYRLVFITLLGHVKGRTKNRERKTMKGR